eukprot:3387530-Rhodomonas_salina.3
MVGDGHPAAEGREPICTAGEREWKLYITLFGDVDVRRSRGIVAACVRARRCGRLACPADHTIRVLICSGCSEVLAPSQPHPAHCSCRDPTVSPSSCPMACAQANEHLAMAQNDAQNLR